MRPRRTATRRARRLGGRGARRPDAARHSGGQGHRRLAHLPRRPLPENDYGHTIYDVDFSPATWLGFLGRQGAAAGRRPHLRRPPPHNVHRGRMKEWAEFYETLFNFKEIRYFDIEGKLTGLKSKAMTSPCGKIRIPINESSDDRSQIQEYLDEYRGEGIQHIALGTSDIYATVDAMKAQGVDFLDTPGTLRASRQASARPRRAARRAAQARDPRRRPRRASCCRSSPRRSSARSSSSSSSARATRASAKATSRRCSSRWSSTRSGAAP